MGEEVAATAPATVPAKTEAGIEIPINTIKISILCTTEEEAKERVSGFWRSILTKRVPLDARGNLPSSLSSYILQSSFLLAPKSYGELQTTTEPIWLNADTGPSRQLEHMLVHISNALDQSAPLPEDVLTEIASREGMIIGLDAEKDLDNFYFVEGGRLTR